MILLTGGSGLLGTELQKYLQCVAPSRHDFDIRGIQDPVGDYDTIIHAAAYTDVVGAERDKEECFNINVTGTKNMVKAYPNAKFVFISSEYAHKPLNYYSWTKKWAEGIVTRLHPNYLILRTSFVPRPFPHKHAFADQYTQGDYVDIIAPMIAAAVLHERKGTKYIGTGRKTMFELARKSVPDILGNSVKDIKEVRLRTDYE